jgi:hypothetical protein
MGKLKVTDQEILDLGKKIVEDLNLDNSTKMLSRWQAHYLAELILGAEKEKDDNDIKLECCNLILDIWKNKERVPIKTFIKDIQPLLKTLELFSKDEYSILDSFRFRREMDVTEISDIETLIKIIDLESSKSIKSILEIIIIESKDKSKFHKQDRLNFMEEPESDIFDFLDDFDPEDEILRTTTKVEVFNKIIDSLEKQKDAVKAYIKTNF